MKDEEMTDIFIKSFNRPYYLERCLESIQRFVQGSYRVIVLDDGTPKKYLDKIQSKFPEVEFRYSQQHDFKVNAIRENLNSGKEIDGFQIPISLWKEAVTSGSEYMIMTEDDVWFTASVDLDGLVKYMKDYEMVLIKLGWISHREIKSEITQLEGTLMSVEPKIFTAPRWFMKNFFFENKAKVFSLMYRLGIVDNETKHEYWCMNAMLMGLFRKEYWLKVWETLTDRVNEKEQLVNATAWYRKNKRPNLFGKLDYEMMNTTFVSSATNSYHGKDKEFDVNRFNYIMNEYWFNDELDSMDSFPKDISKQTYLKILEKENAEGAKPEAWLKWAERFEDQYRRQDVKVD